MSSLPKVIIKCPEQNNVIQSSICNLLNFFCILILSRNTFSIWYRRIGTDCSGIISIATTSQSCNFWKIVSIPMAKLAQVYLTLHGKNSNHIILNYQYSFKISDGNWFENCCLGGCSSLPKVIIKYSEHNNVIQSTICNLVNFFCILILSTNIFSMWYRRICTDCSGLKIKSPLSFDIFCCSYWLDNWMKPGPFQTAN